MIAEKCCGSCENCKQRMNGIVSFHFCEKVNASVEPVTEYYCKDYSPRNPIENKYQKMWDELELELMGEVKNLFNTDKVRIIFNEILKGMKTIQEKHK